MSGFDGDQMFVGAYIPTLDPEHLVSHGNTIVGPGVEFRSPGTIERDHPPPPGVPLWAPTIDIKTYEIDVTYSASVEGGGFAVYPFNGLLFQTAANDIPITGVAVKSTNIAGFTNSRLSFDSHDIAINQSGMRLLSNALGSMTSLSLSATFRLNLPLSQGRQPISPRAISRPSARSRT